MAGEEDEVRGLVPVEVMGALVDPCVEEGGGDGGGEEAFPFFEGAVGGEGGFVEAEGLGPGGGAVVAATEVEGRFVMGDAVGEGGVGEDEEVGGGAAGDELGFGDFGLADFLGWPEPAGLELEGMVMDLAGFEVEGPGLAEHAGGGEADLVGAGGERQWGGGGDGEGWGDEAARGVEDFGDDVGAGGAEGQASEAGVLVLLPGEEGAGEEGDGGGGGEGGDGGGAAVFAGPADKAFGEAGGAGGDGAPVEEGAEVFREGLGGGVAVGGFLGEAFKDNGFEVAGEVWGEGAGGRGIGVEDLGDDLVGGGGFEDRVESGEFVEGGAEAVEVGAVVDGLFGRTRLFWAHVAGRAEERAGEAEGGVVGAAGEAEVGEPDASIGVADEVGGFDIAVDDAPAVGVGEGFGGLEAPIGDVAFGDGGMGVAGVAKALGEVASFDELHGVVADPFGRTDGEDGDDIGMVEAGDGLGLALEALHGDFVGHGAEPKDFEGDAAAEGDLFGFVDHAHAAAADFADEAEVAELGGGIGGGAGGSVDELEAGDGLGELRGQVGVGGE